MESQKSISGEATIHNFCVWRERVDRHDHMYAFPFDGLEKEIEAQAASRPGVVINSSFAAK